MPFIIENFRGYAQGRVGLTSCAQDQEAAEEMVRALVPGFNFAAFRDALAAFEHALSGTGVSRDKAAQMLALYDALLAQRQPTPATAVNFFVSGSAVPVPQIEHDRLVLLAAGSKIEAIKQLRAFTGAGLKEAKDAIEAWVSETPAARGPAPVPGGRPGGVP